MISEEYIESFWKLYKKKFHIELSYEEASIQAMQLIELVELVYQPMTEAEYRQLQKRRKEIRKLTEDPQKKKAKKSLKVRTKKN